MTRHHPMPRGLAATLALATLCLAGPAGAYTYLGGVLYCDGPGESGQTIYVGCVDPPSDGAAGALCAVSASGPISYPVPTCDLDHATALAADLDPLVAPPERPRWDDVCAALDSVRVRAIDESGGMGIDGLQAIAADVRWLVVEAGELIALGAFDPAGEDAWAFAVASARTSRHLAGVELFERLAAGAATREQIAPGEALLADGDAALAAGDVHGALSAYEAALAFAFDFGP